MRLFAVNSQIDRLRSLDHLPMKCPRRRVRSGFREVPYRSGPCTTRGPSAYRLENAAATTAVNGRHLPHRCHGLRHSAAVHVSSIDAIEFAADYPSDENTPPNEAFRPYVVTKAREQVVLDFVARV